MASLVANCTKVKSMDKKAPLFEYETFAVRKIKKTDVDYLVRKRNH